MRLQFTFAVATALAYGMSECARRTRRWQWEQASADPGKKPVKKLPHSLGTKLLASLLLMASHALLRPSATPLQIANPTPPTRDPNTSGYVKAVELPDGTNPPPAADGNFII